MFPFAVPPEQRRFDSGKKVGRPRARKHLRRVPHSRRATFSPRCPVLVTVKLARGLPPMRNRPALEVVHRCLRAARERLGMRITDFTVQTDHLHLVLELDPEALDARGKGLPPEQAAKVILARAMGGLLRRLSCGLNRIWGRKGRVWGDRYHAAVKATPTEVRRARAYVLNNAIHHGRMNRGADPCSSAPWYRPWERFFGKRDGPAPVVEPRTWLGRVGMSVGIPIALPA